MTFEIRHAIMDIDICVRKHFIITIFTKTKARARNMVNHLTPLSISPENIIKLLAFRCIQGS